MEQTGQNGASDGAPRRGGAVPLRFSLDQNFLWNLFNARRGETRAHKHAARLYDLIRRSVARGIVVCPIHTNETVDESSLLMGAKAEMRSGIFSVATELCGGFAFRDITQAIADATLQMLRPGYHPEILLQGTFVPPADLDAHAGKHRQVKNSFCERIRQMPEQDVPAASAWDVYHLIVAQRCGSMVRLLKAIRDHSSTETGREEWDLAAGAASCLLHAGILPAECDQLIELVCQRKWEAIPPLLWHSRLCAQLEFGRLCSGRPSEKPANDYYDLTRLAVALSDADAVFCDKAMLERIEQARSSKGPLCFAWSTSARAIQFLEELLEGTDYESRNTGS